jgi:hypothetical protein
MATRESEPQAQTKAPLQAGPKDARAQNGGGGLSPIFGDIANKTSQAVGRASAFMIAAGIVVVWQSPDRCFNIRTLGNSSSIPEPPS